MTPGRHLNNQITLPIFLKIEIVSRHHVFWNQEGQIDKKNWR
jgi:hypothetical protein